MADGSFSSNSFIRPYRCHTSPAALSFPLGSTASTAVFKVGDAVARGATTNAHRIVVLATGVTANLTGFVGFAAESVTSSFAIGTQVLVWPARRDVEYIGVAKGTFNSTQLGQGYALRRDSTLEIGYLDLADKGGATTAVIAIVTDFVNGSTQGDSNGFVSFTVLDASAQLYRASS